MTDDLADLYLKISNRARIFSQHYWNLQSPLYFHFTHLVCRTALDGKRCASGFIRGGGGASKSQLLRRNDPRLVVMSGVLRENGPSLVVMSGALGENGPSLVVMSGALGENGPSLVVMSGSLGENGPSLVVMSGVLRENGPSLW